jgi:hypothetical protein
MLYKKRAGVLKFPYPSMGFTYGKGNIVSSLRPSGGGAKKWSFFLFSSGKKRPTTRDDAEEGCYCPPPAVSYYLQ